MVFDLNSAKKVVKKSKKGPAKKRETLYQRKDVTTLWKVLDNLLINQEKLTKTEQLRLFVTLSGYLFPKNKPVKKQTEEKLSLKFKDLISFTSNDDTEK